MKTSRILIEVMDGYAIDDEGISTPSWQAVRPAWAAVEHRNGSSKWASGGYQAETTTLFTIHYIPGWLPTPGMRVVWKGALYDIVAVDNIREENREVEIQAKRTERTGA